MATVLFLVLLLVTARLSYAEHSCTCEDEIMSLNCHQGKIQVLSAVYGRQNQSCCPKNMPDSPCASSKSLAVVKEKCENKSSCNVSAENKFFGDPCVYIRKYLEVQYACVLPKCPREAVNVKGVSLTFPEAWSSGQISSVERCLDGSNRSLGTRSCGENWGEAELRRDCYNESTPEDSLAQINLINITTQNVKEVAANINLISNQVDHITPRGLESLITAVESVVAVGTTSEQVTNSVVGVVNNIMELYNDTLFEAANVSNIVLSLESQVARVHTNGENYTASGPYLKVRALQLGKESLAKGLPFDSHFTRNEDNRSDEEEIMTSSLRLPPSVLDIVSMVHPHLSFIPFTLITYLDDRLFKPSLIYKEETTAPLAYVDSNVVSATVELDDVIFRDLPKNSSVLITFSTPTIPPEKMDKNATIDFVCVFWEYNRTVGKGRWSQEGCTRVQSTEKEIHCSCNHLTSFAVLVTKTNSSPDHVILQAIIIVGCVFSMIGLSISIIGMLAVKTVRQKQQTHIHLNLCLALLLFYLSFCIGIDRSDFPEMCKVMTSVIYFFCLSSMGWMSAEAFCVYMLIWNYQRSAFEHFILIAFVCAWGVPAISSLLIYLIFDNHDYTSDTEYCFLHVGSLFYLGFLYILFLMFVFNTTVFVLATYRVNCRKLRLHNNENRNDEIALRVKSTFLFWILLGISWLFGFIATIPGPLSIVFQVMFCALFAFQGFFMFFMLFLQNPEMRKHFPMIAAKNVSPPKQVESTMSTPLQKERSSQENSTDPQTPANIDNTPDEFHEFEIELRSLDDCTF